MIERVARTRCKPWCNSRVTGCLLIAKVSIVIQMNLCRSLYASRSSVLRRVCSFCREFLYETSDVYIQFIYRSPLIDDLEIHTFFRVWFAGFKEKEKKKEKKRCGRCRIFVLGRHVTQEVGD